MLKKVLYVNLIILLLFSFSSCSILQGKINDNSLAQVMKEKKIVIGMEYEMFPMGTLNPNTGETYGFDIDVANELANRMGVAVEFIHVPWATSEDKNVFEKSRADCIWNNLDNTPEREEQYALSIPYINDNKVFMSLQRDSMTTVSELKGKVVGVAKGSSSVYVLNNPVNKEFKNDLEDVMICESNEEARCLLESGRIDAVILDEVIARYYKKTEAEKFRFLEDESGETFYISGAQCVVAFRRESLALRSEINQVLFEMSKDGTISNLSKKWFGEDMSAIK